MATNTVVASLTGGRLLARNVLWNLLGTGAPSVIALIAIPILIRDIGLSRFGVLTIVWTVVGYFSLFDLGLGAALTRMVADRLAAQRETETPAIVWTSLALMFLLGLFGSVVLIALSSPLVHHVLKIPDQLQNESLYAFSILAVGLPFIIATTGLRGILEAYQRFSVVNTIRIPMSSLIFLGPLMVLPFSKSLVPIVTVLVGARLVACGLYFVWCCKTVSGLRERFVWEKQYVRYVVKFGLWLTVSNIISPILVYMDRFLIGTLVSMAAVAYYATPFEVVSKLLLVPAAVAGVLFPAFTVGFAQDRSRTALLLSRGQKYIALIAFPIILIVVTMAGEGLHHWLGADFSRHSTVILQWLAAGVFINCFAQLPWVLIQGGGRPDITAKFHLIELVFYLPILWLMVKHYGVLGAAIGWTSRVFIDAALLAVTADTFLPENERLLSRAAVPFCSSLLLLFAATLLSTVYERAIFLALVLLLLTLVSWLFFLRPERQIVASSRSQELRHPEAV